MAGGRPVNYLHSMATTTDIELTPVVNDSHICIKRKINKNNNKKKKKHVNWFPPGSMKHSNFTNVVLILSSTGPWYNRFWGDDHDLYSSFVLNERFLSCY